MEVYHHPLKVFTKMNNKFVIITPSYNNADWVEYNIASVLNQTYTNWKVLYINDCSTDNTLTLVTDIVKDNPKYTILNNSTNRGAMFNYFEHLDLLDENDIVVHLDGDDWLIDETVLANLNELYNRTNCWMTYGGMVEWKGEDFKPTFPQNTPYDDFIHDHKFYRRDIWRASHLRTYRAFLLKALDKNDLKDLTNHEYYWHASDLSFQYACMEMSGKEKIQPVNFYTCVYNQHPSVVNRTRTRESSNNSGYELEIRNRKRYRTGLNLGKLPLINVVGDFRERNSIPTKFSYVYNQRSGEADITLIQDHDCIRYVNGDLGTLPGVIVADIHEAPHLFNQNSVYECVKNNSHKFDYILTYSEDLLTLPNAIFRNGGYECVLNKNIHSLEHPLLADESLFKLYEKTKNISFITSNKQFTDLHVFRTNCVTYLREANLPVDIYGVGYNQLKRKLDGLKDYTYSIAIENGVFNNYFTEKVLDCFLTGTVPIYKGCPNINKFFNIDGIITFDTQEELKLIIEQISRGERKIDTTILQDNYDRALNFCYNSDRLYEKYFSQMIQQNKV